jgi:hypothetical protein
MNQLYTQTGQAQNSAKRAKSFCARCAALWLVFGCLFVATANEVNNLDSIILLENSIAPFAATHYLPINFDRNSRRGKLKLLD